MAHRRLKLYLQKSFMFEYVIVASGVLYQYFLCPPLGFRPIDNRYDWHFPALCFTTFAIFIAFEALISKAVKPDYLVQNKYTFSPCLKPSFLLKRFGQLNHRDMYQMTTPWCTVDMMFSNVRIWSLGCACVNLTTRICPMPSKMRTQVKPTRFASISND